MNVLVFASIQLENVFRYYIEPINAIINICVDENETFHFSNGLMKWKREKKWNNFVFYLINSFLSFLYVQVYFSIESFRFEENKSFSDLTVSYFFFSVSHSFPSLPLFRWINWSNRNADWKLMRNLGVFFIIIICLFYFFIQLHHFLRWHEFDS